MKMTEKKSTTMAELLDDLRKMVPEKPVKVEWERDPEEVAIRQLAGVLGIETEMGFEYLRQVLSNARLFEKKQRDYGSGNIAMFGERGVIVKAGDKVQRLKHLVFDGTIIPQNEPVRDSWDDLANYGVIGRLCRDGKWK